MDCVTCILWPSFVYKNNNNNNIGYLHSRVIPLDNNGGYVNGHHHQQINPIAEEILNQEYGTESHTKHVHEDD